jgi:6-phosphofructokinase 1
VAGGLDVSDEFLRYARPLIGDSWPSIPLLDGRQRFARLAPVFAEQVLGEYVPQADR